MSRTRILRSLDFGAMVNIAAPLSREDRESVAAFLGTTGSDGSVPREAFCRNQPAAANKTREVLPGVWNGWSPSASNSRFQSAEAAGLSAGRVRELKLKWAFGFDGDISAFGAPTVFEGKLFTGSAAGVVYSLDARTGCVVWTFAAEGPVRSALLAVKSGTGNSLLFGDQNGWFYALDSKTGALRWKRRVEEHESTRLTGSPQQHDGIVFVPVSSWEETRARNAEYQCCTFRGSVVALRTLDGSILWKSYLVPVPTVQGVTSAGLPRYGPSGAAVWSTPTVDDKRGRLYITTGDNYSSPATGTSDAVIALDLKTGKIVWTRQTTQNDVFTIDCVSKGPNCPPESGPDHDYGASAILVTVGGDRDLLLAGQKSGVVYALDPEQEGKMLWSTRLGKGGPIGGIQWGMATDGTRLFAAVSEASPQPRKSTGLDDLRPYDFNPDRRGGIMALRIGDGHLDWSVPGQLCDSGRPVGCFPAQSSAVTAIAGAVFSGSMDGHIRAFVSDTGDVLWDFDTARPYKTVNGVAAKGGSLDGAGPVIAGGMVFVNSGYARFGGMPGNVLLAFSAEH